VTGSEQEVRALGPDILVLVERRGDPLGAGGIRAFADELGIACVKSAGAFGDPLVDVTEQRFSVRDSHFSFSHSRLPSIDCQFKNEECGKSVAPSRPLISRRVA
jgi:hypothetical protein